MNRLGHRAEAVTALLVAAIMASGCATSKLWEEQSYHPADHPNLNLALDPKSREVLVEYQEQREEAKKYQPRAYWLFASTNSIAARGKPVFVNPKDYAGLTPIPLLNEATATNAPALAGYVAVATPAQQGFDLWLDGAPLGRYYLPIYFAKPRATVWRVAVTPFAALGDTTVVIVVCAAVVAVVVGVIYLESEAH
jgi:hypothetical protein